MARKRLIERVSVIRIANQKANSYHCMFALKLFLAICLLAIACEELRAAAPFGSKPIRLVVASGPESRTGQVARSFAQELQRSVREVTVDYRPGEAAQIVGQAAPDGNTLLIGTAQTEVTFPLWSKELLKARPPLVAVAPLVFINGTNCGWKLADQNCIAVD